MTTVTEPLTVNPEQVAAALERVQTDNNLPEDAALTLRNEFGQFYTDIVMWRDKAATITDETDPLHQKMAREVRLKLRAARIDVERVRKALKEESLRRGKAIDGFANVLKYLCEPVEKRMDDIEKYAERMEAERIERMVQERTAELVATGNDPTAYNLAAMDDATFAMVLKNAKRIQAEVAETAAKAEADRIAQEEADRKERERIQQENERLRKEAAEREAAAKVERDRIEAERAKERAADAAKLRETEARLKREAAEREAVIRKEREAAAVKQREIEAQAAKLNAERKKVKAERAAAAKAEADRKAAEAAAKRKAERAPDKEKILAFARTILDIELPKVKTPAAHDAMIEISAKRDGFAVWIENQANALDTE